MCRVCEMSEKCDISREFNHEDSHNKGDYPVLFFCYNNKMSRVLPLKESNELVKEILLMRVYNMYYYPEVSTKRSITENGGI